MSPILHLLKKKTNGHTNHPLLNNSSSMSKQRNKTRMIHSWLSIIVGIPLCASAVTGAIYAVSRHWFEVDKESLKIWIIIHQGSYLGDAVYYVTCLFVIILPLWFTGIRMLGLKRTMKRMFGFHQHPSMRHYDTLGFHHENHNDMDINSDDSSSSGSRDGSSSSTNNNDNLISPVSTPRNWVSNGGD